MGAGAVEVLIYLGDEFGLPHRVRGVTLEHRLGAHTPPIAFQIAVGTIRSHLLEICAKGVPSQQDKPILERFAAFRVERQAKTVDIDGSLQFIHGAPTSTPPRP